MKNFRILPVACLVLLQIGCAAQKEVPPGLSTAITGLVRDQSGAEIAGVQVELRNSADSTLLRTTFTNKAGEFAFANMPAGAYRLTLTLKGFQTVTRDASANTDKFSRVDVLMPLSPEMLR